MTNAMPETLGQEVMGVFRRLVAFRWLVVAPALLAGTLAGSTTLFSTRTFTSSASFMPEAGSNAMASYAALASQLGLQVPTVQDGPSPEFYVYLLQSNALLTRVVRARFAVTEGEAREVTPLPRLIGVPEGDSLRTEFNGLRELRKLLKIRYDARSGLIVLSVKTKSRALSRALADSLVAQVDWFNRQVRRTQASEERRFTEARLSAAREDLRNAEDEYQGFLERNRVTTLSPALTFQGGRLRREVTDREQLVASLRQAFEQARLQEVRNTPVISVIETPAMALIPDRRFTIAYTLLGTALGGLVAALFVLVGTTRKGAGPYAHQKGRGWVDDLSAMRSELLHPSQVLQAARRQWNELRGRLHDGV